MSDKTESWSQQGRGRSEQCLVCPTQRLAVTCREVAGKAGPQRPGPAAFNDPQEENTAVLNVHLRQHTGDDAMCLTMSL